MHKKEIMNNRLQMRKNTRITTIVVIFLVFLFTLSTANAMHTCSATTSSSDELTINEKIVQERYVDNNSVPLSTKTLLRNSIILLNITVLLQSNSSVEIFSSEEYREGFSPTLTNVTLAPGESFAENYTILGVSNANEVGYYCRSTLAGANATVQWWYEVLFSAKPSGFIGVEFLFISGVFILSTMTLVLITKRKSNKKND